MDRYDPEVKPDPAEWLELDEQERIMLVEDYHRAERIELPNVKVHAVIHSVVENQIAEGISTVVLAMDRLMGDGLDRHEALHAVGSVLAEHLYEAINAGSRKTSGSVQSRYEAELRLLTAKRWRKRYGK